ncbi:NADH-quinone oxidoreductase subunit J [soil metagenome]
MPAPLFYLFAAMMLVFGVLVVTLRNPVSGALSLVVSFVGLAGLFISLNAYFIGVIQILVYAGAVMVLFLFIIMLLDLKGESKVGGKTGLLTTFGGLVLVGAFAIQLIGVLGEFEAGQATLDERPIAYQEAAALRMEHRPAGSAADSVTAALAASTLPDVKLVGEALFTDYHLHLQIIAVLLLVSTVGVVVLSKRELK